ncbi:MAG: hypothetical protein IPQ07_32575 [Myxococcales bacterium]|nr:hypothetical protein [Myxococcales bacterium]
MDDTLRASAERMRSLLVAKQAPPDVFRAALTSVPALERDAWVDHVLELDPPPEDGPELPRGCVPYLPCAVDVLLRVVDYARVQGTDVFVDVGSGVGRAAALVHLLTGAPAIGLEIQPALALASRALTERFSALRFSPVIGDATVLAGSITIGSIFFFYCPFSGDRLDKVLDDLEQIARTREIRICCVDLPLPLRPWLTLASPPAPDLAVYRSTLLDPPA